MARYGNCRCSNCTAPWRMRDDLDLPQMTPLVSADGPTDGVALPDGSRPMPRQDGAPERPDLRFGSMGSLETSCEAAATAYKGFRYVRPASEFYEWVIELAQKSARLEREAEALRARLAEMRQEARTLWVIAHGYNCCLEDECKRPGRKCNLPLPALLAAGS